MLAACCALASCLAALYSWCCWLTAIQTEAASLGSVHVSCVLRLSIVLGCLVQLVLLAAVAVSPSALAGPKRVFVGAAHLAVILFSVVSGAAELTAIQTEAASLGSVHVSCVLRLSIVLGCLVQLVLLAAVAVSPSALAGPKRVFIGAAHLAVILFSVVSGAA